MIPNKNKTNIRRLAAASMISALSFALMYVGTLAVVFDLSAAALGALGTAFAVIELRGPWPWLTAATCSVLCLLLLPDKFVALEYIMLGGLYPIVKSYVERLPKIPQWVLKLVYINVLLTVCLLLAKYVLMIDESWAVISAAVYAMANAAFIVFDLCLTVLISAYVNRLRKRLKIKL